MVKIIKKQFFLTLSEIWFSYKFKWTDIFLPVCYRGIRDMDQRFYFGVKKATTTVVLELDKPEEEIYSGFFTSNKKDIKKAEAEGVTCFFHNDIKGFIEFYNDFAASRNLPGFDINRMEEFMGEEWKFSNAVLNGQVLVTHSYIEDKETGIVRSMQSGSLRLNEKYNPRQIAQANKLLHYFDIKYFRERGFKYYDFGGWNDLPGLLEFKQSFGAHPINILNFFTYTYFLKEKIQDVLRSIKKK